MHLIDGAGHVNNQFVAEDMATNRPPTEITAEWLNAVQAEISNAAIALGYAPDKTKNDQLATGITSWAIQAVSTMAVLRTIQGVASRRIMLMGYYADNDGGQGVFYWDASSVSADNGGTIINPAGHDGAGRWMRMINTSFLSALWFGAIGNLQADDHPPAQACLNAAVAGRYDVIFPKKTGYKFNAQLIIYIDAVSVDFCGNLIDLSGIGAGTAFALATQAGGDENISALTVKLNSIRRGLLVGPGPDTAGSKCFDFTGVLKWIHSVTVNHCSITGYDVVARVFTNGFLIDFDHCNFLQASAQWDINTVLDMPGGGLNYGEAIKFNSCQFVGAGIVANIEAFASVFFNNCSFDYNTKIVRNTGGGDVIVTGGHIESSTDTDYWFEAINDNSKITIIGSPILLTGPKIKEVGYSSAASGGISIIGGSVEGDSSYTPSELITGPGRVVVKELSYEWSGNKIMPSKRLNQVPFNGDFENANSLSTWGLFGTTPPALSALVSHSGAQSLRVQGGVGTNNGAVVSVPVRPGDSVFVEFWYQVPAVTGTGGTFYAHADFTDANRNVISAGSFVAVTSDLAAWTRAVFHFQPVVPPGVTHVSVTFEFFSVGTGLPVAYIDDLCVVPV